ncbi:Peptidoglycan-binding lysin domain-containing protein [Cynara cardunculus var. scolymus]|uniref:Peptidoglycan-binding lysin domain-containing protein n=1 Tax=Cynara cardunculus var. scolymus TaxID=59895 RepID=A0A118JY81_CYNCS|nr:Peptidoglycan-binding lysin domain-containing protein [Cynara cardunculus var. scolymus]
MADSFPFFLTLLLFSFIKPMLSVQPYDPTPCITSTDLRHGSTYICTSTTTKTCNTFLVYRPQFNQSLSAIATLFNLNQSQLHQAQEVIVPIICDCPDSSSRAIASYSNLDLYTVRDIACGVYQGMVNPQVVAQQNANNHEPNKVVKVPVKCACTDSSHETTGTKYLVTYPVMDNDTIDMIAWKFGVTQASIQEANGLGPKQTIFGGTTLLVPTTGVPVLNLEKVVNNPSPQDTIPVNGISKRSTGSSLLLPVLIVLGIISLFGVVSFLVFLKWKYGHRERPLESITGSEFRRFSPDFIDGISKLKHILTSFDLDELRLATQDFSESSFIGKSVYKVKIAFDVAEALHYIHSCTKPTYVHRNISTRNVLITMDWRAKITGFNLAVPIIYTASGRDWTEKKGYLSPEYLDHGRVSTKVDVYAYGVVLLELLSAKEAATGRKWSEDVGFLADGEVAGDSPGCLEKFKVFMDADLEDLQRVLAFACIYDSGNSERLFELGC